MKKFMEKLLECLVALLPFFRKKETAKEFSELITSQYGFLIEQLEKALKDYFELSAQVKEMHAEMIALREQKCRNKECNHRES